MQSTSSVVLVSALLLGIASVLPADDWPMEGRNATRNPVSPEKGAPRDWDVATGKNVKWSAKLGSQTYAAPVVANGRVYVGTNNGAGYLQRYPASVDLGCLLCFRESDGELLWQYSAEKLPSGRVHDWPYQGLGSSPLVEGERLWFVNNRWEVICADTRGFQDGENDGPYVDEPVDDPREADVVWKYDLMAKLGVEPHTAGMGPDRRCSIAASYQNRIYVVTGNGVDESHVRIPAPNAPSLVCFHKDTGEVLWTDNSPGPNILHTQIANPLVAEIAGRGQVIVPQGDGWIRSFDPLSGELIWKFDINFKASKWAISQGGRNNILATPVLYENRLYIASGQESEHGSGMGRLVAIDPTKTGDISSELAIDRNGRIVPHRRTQAVDPSQGEKAIPNPNSGLIWEFGSKTLEQYEKQPLDETMHRAHSSVAVHDGLVIAEDLIGFVHCLDAVSGKRYWTYDAFANFMTAPLIVGDTVYVADEDGDVAVFHLAADPDLAMKRVGGDYQPLAEISVGSAVYAAPTYANGTLYIANRSTLYAISERDRRRDAPRDQTAEGDRPAAEQRRSDVPGSDVRRVPNAAFVPTPHDVVARMLELAEVQKGDVVCDLGSGDGRIVIAAARDYGCPAVGYEIDPELARLSRENAKEAEVHSLVTIKQADVFTADLSDADVVTLYLLPIQVEKLIPQLKQLKPGSRIVAHEFPLPGIPADRKITVHSRESGEQHTLHLWTAPIGSKNK